MAFVGGLEARIFYTNDCGLIRQEITSYIEGMKARGARLVFASDHSLTPRVAYSTYRYTIELFKEHRRYS